MVDAEVDRHAHGRDIHPLVWSQRSRSVAPRVSAVAWSGCVTACETWTSSTRANLVWSESRDSGATWFAGQVIGSSASVDRPSLQRLSVDPVAIGHGPTRAVERRHRGNGLLPLVVPDWDRCRRSVGGHGDGSRDDVPRRRSRRPSGLGHPVAISRSALTDRPGNRKSACRLAGALRSGLGIVTRRP